MRLRRLQLRQQALGGLEFAQVAPQHRVDESRLDVKAALPGQLDRLVHCGMGGDAIEPKDLIKAQPQEALQHGLLHAPFGLPGDQPIQRRLPADDAVGQLLAQMPVRGRKPGTGQFGLQPVLHEIPPRLPPENAQCNFSWFFVAHNL